MTRDTTIDAPKVREGNGPNSGTGWFEIGASCADMFVTFKSGPGICTAASGLLMSGLPKVSF